MRLFEEKKRRLEEARIKAEVLSLVTGRGGIFWGLLALGCFFCREVLICFPESIYELESVLCSILLVYLHTICVPLFQFCCSFRKKSNFQVSTLFVRLNYILQSLASNQWMNQWISMKTLRRIGRDWRKPTKNVSRPSVKFAVKTLNHCERHILSQKTNMSPEKYVLKDNPFLLKLVP